MSRHLRPLAIFGLAAGLAFAQQGSLEGPLTGYIFDEAAHAIRPVTGIPGAALIGEPLDLGFPARSAWIAPRQDSAIVLGADGIVRFIRFGSQGISPVAVRDVDDRPQSVVFSPSGTSAALQSANSVQLITGLPDSPRVSGRINLSSANPGSGPARNVTPRRFSMAVSDDASYLLFVNSGAVRLLSINGEDRRLVESAPGALAAFAPNGHDAAITDPRGDGLLFFHDFATSGARHVIAPADERLASAAALAFSPSGAEVYLAAPENRAVQSFNVTTGNREEIRCDCAPAGLTRMGSVFRLNEMGSGPLWLMDGTKTIFVPAR